MALCASTTSTLATATSTQACLPLTVLLGGQQRVKALRQDLQLTWHGQNSAPYVAQVLEHCLPDIRTSRSSRQKGVARLREILLDFSCQESIPYAHFSFTSLQQTAACYSSEVLWKLWNKAVAGSAQAPGPASLCGPCNSRGYDSRI